MSTPILVFSAILNTKSNIADLFLNSHQYFDFYSCHFLWYEIDNHRDKLIEISKKDKKAIVETEHLIYNEIHFIDEEQIPKDNLLFAIELVKDIDEKDIVFIALNEYLDTKLWTGDKKLINGLKSKGYNKIISTQEMIELRYFLEQNQ
ncbi:MAG: hypothetical protein K9H64_14455 [Bacteroidales bacterium]|nr:hypothetical protein [Bacteroidales bacterium]MCF8457169.1 hypothetical protein [Bacteroidales bacterium]